MEEKTEKIKKKVKKALDKDRYQHTLGVAYTAASLAMRYGYDMEKAYVAGLLHDCAKCIDNDEKYAMCKKYKIELNEIEKVAPYLVHAKLGAFIAESEYGVSDPEVLNAIRFHTTGRPGMNLLEKIIFTADYIEPHRSEAPNLTQIRQMAFEKLDSAVKKILYDTLNYINAKRNPVDPQTEETYNYYFEGDKTDGDN